MDVVIRLLCVSVVNKAPPTTDNPPIPRWFVCVGNRITPPEERDKDSSRIYLEPRTLRHLAGKRGEFFAHKEPPISAASSLVGEARKDVWE